MYLAKLGGSSKLIGGREEELTRAKEYFSCVPRLECRFLQKDTFYVRDEDEVVICLPKMIDGVQKLGYIIARFSAVIGVEAPLSDPSRLQFLVLIEDFTSYVPVPLPMRAHNRIVCD